MPFKSLAISPSARRQPRWLRSLAATSALVLIAAVLRAAEPVRRSYDLPAGDAAATLKKFVEQSGEQLLFLVTKVRGIRTNRAKVVVIDITGVAAMDATVANHLVQTVDASGGVVVDFPNNAKKQGYVDASERGAFKINSVGENLVAMTLPAGRNGVPKKSKPRKKRA